MEIIKLNWLHLKNFKGIKDFKLMADGKSANVYGNNAVGKTSVKDAFMWLLFDKDSSGNSDTKFDIKPQDSLGQDINHLQTVVEAELLVDGKPLKIKKMREEKWVTRHGTTESVMDRHVKSYWFNEVPVKAREYQSRVDELVNEKTFKMVTDPLYFNTQMKWEERRKELLKISGDATDEEVIASDESLAPLSKLLQGRTIEEYKLVIADQLKGYKKDRDNIPPRIDELTLSLPQEEPDYTVIETELKKHKEELATVEFLLTNATNKANKITEKYNELARLKGQLEETKASIDSEETSGRRKQAKEQSELSNQVFILENSIKSLESQIRAYERQVKVNETSLVSLREEYTKLTGEKAKVLASEFIAGDIEKTCPTCSQNLLKENIDKQIEAMEENFKSNKDKEVQNLNNQINSNIIEGKTIKEKTEKLGKEIEKLNKEMAEKETTLTDLRNKIGQLEKELSQPPMPMDYTQFPEHNQLLEKIEHLQAELDKPVEDNTNELLERKAEIQSKIEELNKALSAKERVEKDKARIEELKTKESKVSAKIAELEGHKFLLDRFTVAKVNLLEDSINSQFKHVKFKLFEENITNEGINPTCITLVNTNGSYVDYNTNGNLAGTYNAGLDIINTLCKFYGVTVPIFFDNRESVTEIIETDSQVINLIKPEIRNEEDRKKYSQLVVEVE